jgi:hypothetical protein
MGIASIVPQIFLALYRLVYRKMQHWLLGSALSIWEPYPYGVALGISWQLYFYEDFIPEAPGIPNPVYEPFNEALSSKLCKISKGDGMKPNFIYSSWPLSGGYPLRRSLSRPSILIKTSPHTFDLLEIPYRSVGHSLTSELVLRTRCVLTGKGNTLELPPGIEHGWARKQKSLYLETLTDRKQDINGIR